MVVAGTAASWAGPVNAGHEDVVIDAAYAQLLRHHTSTPEEMADVVAFSQETFTTRQLGILFANMGPRLPLLVPDMRIERKRQGGLLRADLRFDLHVRWSSGRLKVSQSMIPHTLATAMTGRPMRAVLDHPYVPDDLVVASVGERDGTWVFVAGLPAAIGMEKAPVPGLDQ